DLCLCCLIDSPPPAFPACAPPQIPLQVGEQEAQLFGARDQRMIEEAGVEPSEVLLLPRHRKSRVARHADQVDEHQPWLQKMNEAAKSREIGGQTLAVRFKVFGDQEIGSLQIAMSILTIVQGADQARQLFRQSPQCSCTSRGRPVSETCDMVVQFLS